MLTHNLGFPRIGLNRELKRAQEQFWKGTIDEEELQKVASELRMRHWKLQAAQGVDIIPVGDFSLYDHMLEMSAALGAVPERFGWDGTKVDLRTFFNMARGGEKAHAMEMTKWFDTNYHYIVPEFTKQQTFKLSSDKIFNEAEEAKAAGFTIKAVLPGPVTYIHLGKVMGEKFDRWEHLNAILSVYEEITKRLAKDCEWIQFDEPAMVLDLPEPVREKFIPVYKRLKAVAGGTKVMVATYFGGLGENEELAASLPVDALHVDLVRSPETEQSLPEKIPASMALSLGIVNGRNIWRVDAEKALGVIERVKGKIGAERIMLAPSCSLQHAPIDLDAETGLDPEIRNWMAFAKQKCAELRLLADIEENKDVSQALEENRKAWASRRASPRVMNEKVRARMSSITEDMYERSSPHGTRKAKQQEVFNLPCLPTTTIGSFPQTGEIRKIRRQFKNGEISENAYRVAMEGFIKDAVVFQHEVGLDVLVHGEPERNDMVEYFGEQLEGFCFTANGWVQSYGSRCVKPPVIFGDVSRPRQVTVEWIKYAQSLTDKPMKGMLTGPVTILCWSFVRDDQPRKDTCKQIALAIRDEVCDLERAGIGMIQIDEAALREGLPLRRKEWDEYLEWAVGSFKLTASGVGDATQIHTHMCYSEFNEIAEWIAKMDADVISIEASRSKMELLNVFEDFEYPNDIGPGVYDIHSPRVPSEEEMVELIRKALKVVHYEKLWINPDCGLKTRAWPETTAALKNMVAAAEKMRI
ncbi:MAG: 5-methyltetrahydropteroyltriglutamate--homocysteine S-methyltransferase [Planctomycetes bacterium]|nr:5-methyltetrahydropteroyltriglutamate--homocysteine S-methyltransferase [Planctomycetota bacterium]